MSTRLFPIEPLTRRQRRWFNLIPKSEIDRNFTLGLVIALASGLFLGGLLGLTLADWFGGVFLMAIGLPLLLFALLLVRFTQVHCCSVGATYSWDFFRSYAAPKSANLALRALAEDDLELARQVGRQYWDAVEALDKQLEQSLREQLTTLHDALKERQRLEAQVSGRGDLTSKLAQVREFNDDVRRLLQKEV